MSVNHSTNQEVNRDVFPVFFKMKVYCEFALELPH